MTKSKPTISVILIAKNEACNVVRCLDSVRWADEIIVFDSGSTDDTVELCKQYTPHVFVTDWPGFGPQKNRALDKVTSDWVLTLDADEFLSPELSQKIQEIIISPQAKNIYKIRRITQFCGQYLYYGDWKSDYPLKLFKRHKARFKDVPIHEALVGEGKVGKIKEIIWHHSYGSLEDMINKMNTYSTLSALQFGAEGKTGGILKASLKALWTFLRGYIFKFGFLDGKYGFLLAIANAEGCFYKYIKLSLLQNQQHQQR